MRAGGKVDTGLLEPLEHRLVAALARHMQELHLWMRCRVLDDTDHREVDGARAAAAARDEDRQFLRIEAERRRALLALCREHFAANRVTREDDLIGREVLHGLFRARRDLRHELREDLVGDARHDILLLYERRDVHEAGRKQDRPADVAARADDDVRLELVDDARGLGHADHRAAGAQDVVGRQMALEPLDVDCREGQSFLGDDVSLEAALRADVEESRVGHLLLDGPDDGDGRVDMAARAAA